VRFLHTPEHAHGYVGTALSSNLYHFLEEGGEYRAEKVIDVDDREHGGWEMPVPGLPTDILISMDDRYLFVSNWLDGERLYWTDSLYSTWDDQFYPELAERGSVILKADVDPREGRMELDEEFLVDFGDLPEGPARAHEIRWPDGRTETLAVAPDEAVLEGTERAGVGLPYGCRRGVCATCMGRLLAGDLEHRREPRAPSRIRVGSDVAAELNPSPLGKRR
jgi:ferredoxin